MTEKIIPKKWHEFFSIPQKITNVDSFKNEDHLVEAVSGEINDLMEKAINLKIISEKALFFHFIHLPSINAKFSLQSVPVIINKNSNNSEIGLMLISLVRNFITKEKVSFIRPATKLISEEQKGLLMLITNDQSFNIKNNESYDVEKINIINEKPYKGFEKTSLGNYDDYQYIVHCEEPFKLYKNLINIDSYKEANDSVLEYSKNIIIDWESNDFLKKIWANELDAKKYFASNIGFLSYFLKHEEEKYYIFTCIPKSHHSNINSIQNIGGIGSVFMFSEPPNKTILNNIYLVINRIANVIVKYSVAYSVIPLFAYKNSLDIFSHHTGNLFKESGLSNLENRIQNLAEYDIKTYEYLIHLKQRLMIIWGIKEAINIIKEGFRQQWFCKKKDLETFNQTAAILRQLCFFIMDGQLSDLDDDIRELKFIEINGTLYSPRDITKKRTRFPCLPPFTTKNDDGKEATSAVTFGLFELIRNACSIFNKNEIEKKILDYLSYSQ
jgi:hypothetical protein